jgi:hypothetical protein
MSILKQLNNYSLLMLFGLNHYYFLYTLAKDDVILIALPVMNEEYPA